MDTAESRRRGLIPIEELEDGSTEVFPDEVEASGPVAGQYRLLREELGAAVNPNDPLPVFLHERYTAFEKTWVQEIEDPGDEARVAEVVKRQLQSAVESEMAGGAVPIGPSFTRGLMTPWGPVVHGICVMARESAS